MRTALIPGSFDPLTLGHVDIIERAAKLFDRVVIVISTNSDKKGMFTFSQRKKIAEVSCAHIPNVSVITADGIIADLALAMGACAIVKGVRNMTDFDWEKTLYQINKLIAPNVETIFIPAAPEKQYISSSFVREMIKYEKSLVDSLSPEAIELIINDFAEEK